MNAELKYNGYTAQPSDYECQDGDLAAVLNLMPEKGALHPVTEPKNILHYSGNGKVHFVHQTNNYKHFIAERMTNVQYIEWADSESVNTWHSLYVSSRYDSSSILEIIQITAVGNTLVILTTTGMLYFLWQQDENDYLPLGGSIPETVLSFGLQGKMVESNDYDTGTITLNTPLSSLYEDLDDDNIDQVTNAVLAKVNKFIADEATNAGKFVAPFFVRYAYRLYDGTLTRHSAPILMLPATSQTNPVAVIAGYTYDGGRYTKVGFSVVGAVHQLDYAIKSQSQLTALERWKDIVRSIDIFISAPLYKYDQNGKCKATASFRESDWYCVCKHSEQDPSINQTNFPVRYQKNTMYRLREMQQINAVHHVSHTGVAVLPQISDEAFNTNVKECSNFYFLKSIPIDELSLTRTVIEVADDYLPSLVTREAMTDDYDSHDKLLPGYAFNYNSRLNITNLQKELFRGFESLNLFNYTNGFAKERSATSNYLEYDTPESLRCIVYIKQDGREIIVETTVGSIAQNAPIHYFYFPNPNAYKALFIRGGRKYEVTLSQHPFLNGSVYFSNWEEMQEASSATIPSETSRNIEIRNKIYTSEINNPFLFPLLGINTVGTGVILGISTAAKALSQGQFGQFPLYAFTTEGVWALEVSATTGAFSARQPITRDVCINPDSITQIDSAVLFATDRGIMLISGSQTQCITETIDNDDEPFDFASLPLASNIKAQLGITASTGDALTEKKFSLFIEDCQMLYAYNRQAIIVFSPTYGGYAYIYSLETKQWGKIDVQIRNRILSYPEALAFMVNGDVVDFSNEEEDFESSKPQIFPNQFLITRPIKLDASLKDVHKTIDTIITRGNFTRGHVKTVLYGSRDLHSWFPIYTSVDHFLRHFRGTPYKYFRIALICSLTHDESIWGSSIQYTPKLTNQPR